MQTQFVAPTGLVWFMQGTPGRVYAGDRIGLLATGSRGRSETLTLDVWIRKRVQAGKYVRLPDLKPQRFSIALAEICDGEVHVTMRPRDSQRPP